MQKYILGLLLFLLIVGNAYGQDNNDETKYYNMGLYYAKKGNYDKAIESFKKAIEINPGFAEAYYTLGYAYEKKDNYVKAIENLMKTIEINPDYADAYLLMGILYSRKSNYDASIKCFTKVAKIKPDEVIYFQLAAAYTLNNKYDKAIECCTKAIEINPDYAKAYVAMGMNYFQKERKITAADYLYRAGLKFIEQDNREGVLETLETMNILVPGTSLIKKLTGKLYIK